MNWSRTKTVFIMTFLFLNIFLGWQLYKVNVENQYSLISGNTIQDKLRQNQISIDVELPEDMQEAEYIVGQKQRITTEMVESLSNQTAELQDEDTILSTLEEPFELGEDNTNVTQFLSTYVLNGEEYRVVREVDNIIYLDQVFADKVVYTNHNEPLRITTNNEREIISYEQDYSVYEKQGNPKDTLINLRAIETLFNQQYITLNQSIVGFELGYYSFFRESHVFAPIFKIDVDKGDEQVTYLVNAFEGIVQEQGILDDEDEQVSPQIQDNPVEEDDEDDESEEDIREED
ncbi:two-component system regulatory protein YycI [Alkalicoccobacillus murimartini]|uniref:Regulatory protein YycI of two-component signal transduction system YycFG n=1 Tax=Alkalicoccobacillus murimartini TaxID=171685 RepID=A0ABT9YMN5_9BACI|nr:two-component system regulatory protein YycI [Alkalicoccobacillus murimartini]MDQ0209108.1 regulatory protein YycI of two-component signal transduction system YycFG [Alkalicoccobacillus murimartini]